MIYWPLFWKEYTLRRKAWIQTPFELILMTFALYMLTILHLEVSESIATSRSHSQTLMLASLNTKDYFFAYYPSTSFTEEIMDDDSQDNKHGLQLTNFDDRKVTTVPLKSETGLYELVTKYYSYVLVGFTFYEKNSGKYLTNESNIEDGIHIKVQPTFFTESKEMVRELGVMSEVPDYGKYLQYIENSVVEYLLNAEVEPADFDYTIRGYELSKAHRHNVTMDAMMLALGAVLTLYVLVYRMVNEKETKLRELMRLSGVGNTPYYLTLFTVHFVILFLYSLFSVYLNTDICDTVVLFIVYTLFTVSSVLFTMALTTVFNNKTCGNTSFVIVWLGVPAILLISLFLPNNNYEKEMYCFLACIFAPPTYAVGLFKQLCVNSVVQKGNVLSFDKLSNTLDGQEFLSPLMVIIALVLSTIFWFLWLLYVGEIWPWQEGIPKPWHFPVSYFMKQKTEKSQNLPPKSEEYFETTPSDLKCAISVENIRKRFGFSREVLKGVNLEIYSGQITVLLGHNGAGKTTLMSLMTGLLPATSGRITINGYDIEKQTKEARRSVGLCTQSNTQFELFTIEDHLYFFGLIKGCNLTNIGPEIDRVLKLLNLEDKRYAKPNTTSGGMRRKLQIAIAFIGGSTILILDEPSSGLDVETRRVIWDMLLAVRRKYLILITTHHMEEADCLGDRIAIMSQGEVKCCGTPMFLKRTFGVGYFIRIAKSDKFDQQQCEGVLLKHLKSVKFQKDTPTDILYSFMKDETHKLPELFDELEDVNTKRSLGIASVGISVTSMDDVFLKVGMIFDKSDAMNTQKPSLTNLLITDSQPKSALVALILKRFHNMKRQPFTILFLLGWIALFSFLMAFLMNRTPKPISHEWSMNLTFAELNLQSKRGICVNNTLFCEKAKKIGQSFNIEIVLETVAFEKFNKLLSDDTIFGLFVRNFDVRTKDIHQDINILVSNKDPLVLMIVRTILANTMYALKKNTDLVLITTSFNPQKTLITSYNPPTSILILIPVMYLTLCVSPLLYPSAEKESSAKLLQMMTGIHVTTYWAANLIFDVLLITFYSLPFFITIAVYYIAFDCIIVFSDFQSLVLFVTVMFIFFVTTTTMSHLLSFVFNGLAIVFMILAGIMISINIRELLPVLALKKAAKFISETIVPHFPLMSMFKAVDKVSMYSHEKSYCDNVFTLWPMFCNQSVEIVDNIYQKCCSDNSHLGVSFSIQEVEQISLAIAFFVAVIAIEMIIDWSKRRKTEDHVYKIQEKEDSDVTNLRLKAEAVFKNKEERDKLSLAALNVTKKYGTKTVVDHLSFVVEPKHCFGLLGVNGAGKTTTFKMMIGDVSMTYGESYVNGISVFERGYKYRKAIGYCPQFDAFVPNLTGREMLYLFARLRGYRRTQLRDAVEKMIEFVDLQDYASYVAENYSGGNKRKLSIGLAMIGFPSLLFLDEPTAGVDPVARRKVWSIIETCRETVGSSIILTSHSMDECENLCSIIGIMVNGTFRCIGSTQHLKTKFGKGYTIALKIDAIRDNAKEVRDEMEKLLPKAQLKDAHTTVLVYHFDDTSVTLGNVFRILEKVKETHQLEDYQLNDADLEQIFLGFARGE